MVPSACPRCGFAKAPNGKCLRCGALADTSLTRPPQNARATRVPGRAGAAPAVRSAPSSPVWRVFRWLRWGATALAVIILFLVLRPSEPPEIRRDPDAPRRLEHKLRRLEEPATGGGVRSLSLDEPELNSWMRSTLDVAPGPQTARPAPSSAAARRDSYGGSTAPGAAGRITSAPAENGTPLSGISGDAPTQMTVEEVQSKVLDVRAHLVGDRVVAYVLFDIYGKEISLELQGRLSVRGGYLRLDPTTLWIGSLPIPESTVQGAVERLFADPAHRETFRVPVGVRDIRVENSQLVVDYK